MKATREMREKNKIACEDATLHSKENQEKLKLNLHTLSLSLVTQNSHYTTLKIIKQHWKKKLIHALCASNLTNLFNKAKKLKKE